MSLPFYRARPGEPMGVRRRRRFGFSHGRLTAYEDEDLTRVQPLAASDILESEIERPRTGPMRDIVATIQPEQDIIVRAGAGPVAVRAGRPGHRQDRGRPAPRRVPAVRLPRPAGPLRGAGGRPERQLPVLHRRRAAGPGRDRRHPGHGRVAGRPGPAVAIRGVDPVPAALVKGDARMAEVLRRAVWSHLGRPTVPAGRAARRAPVAGRRATSPTEIIDELRARGVRYEAGRAMLPQRLAHQVLLRMEASGDSPDDRVQNAVARSKPVRAYADALWPALDAAQLVLRLLTDAEFLAAAAEGVLTADEQQLILMRRPAALAGRGPLDARRRGLDRRGRGPAEPDPEPGARDRGRGPGPLADDAAGGRPAGQHRFGHRARRPGPGHHPVGDPVLVGVAGPPRPARGGRHGAGGRLPGAGCGDRLRGPAAAEHRARADAAALGPPTPRRAACCGRAPDPDGELVAAVTDRALAARARSG